MCSSSFLIPMRVFLIASLSNIEFYDYVSLVFYFKNSPVTLIFCKAWSQRSCPIVWILSVVSLLCHLTGSSQSLALVSLKTRSSVWRLDAVRFSLLAGLFLGDYPSTKRQVLGCQSAESGPLWGDHLEHVFPASVWKSSLGHPLAPYELLVSSSAFYLMMFASI